MRSGEFCLQRAARVLESGILGAAERPRTCNHRGLRIICQQPADLRRLEERLGGVFVRRGVLPACRRADPGSFQLYGLRRFGQSLFDPKDKTRGLVGGHARQWYGDLCDYALSRPGFADGDLWCSNGPIYVAEVFRSWQRAWLHTVSLCAVLVLLARRGGERKEIAALFTDRGDVVPDELRRAFGVAAAG